MGGGGGRGGENPPTDYCFGFCIRMNQSLFFFLFFINYCSFTDERVAVLRSSTDKVKR